jgi:hypothetical protein
MGRRSRQRGQSGKQAKLDVPTASYDTGDGTLVLRAVLTPKTRTQYADVLAGTGRPAATQEDAWQRAVEFLFERLAVSWELGGVAYEGQKELLQRFRVTSIEERRAVRDAVRQHCAEYFPEVQAP